MATITTANNNSALNSSRRSYVAVGAFNYDFFSYTVAMNSSYVNVGTLSPVTTDDTLTPAGRVLRENGRKLYPDANPGVTTYMVGVYDDVTFLSGFIDPNSPVFTIFNSDRPNYLPVGTDPNGGLVDSGAPVYTNGSATVGDGLSVTGGATVPSATITAATYTTASGVLEYTAAHSFVVGETVTVSGVTVSVGSAAVYNITGVIATVTGVTKFTIISLQGAGTNTYASGGVATLVQPTLVVDSANTKVSGGLVLEDTGLYVKVNKIAGVATLVGGAITVTTPVVNGSSVVIITPAAATTAVYYVLRFAGKFEIHSSNGSDTTPISWLVINTVN